MHSSAAAVWARDNLSHHADEYLAVGEDVSAEENTDTPNHYMATASARALPMSTSVAGQPRSALRTVEAAFGEFDDLGEVEQAGRRVRTLCGTCRMRWAQSCRT